MGFKILLSFVFSEWYVETDKKAVNCRFGGTMGKVVSLALAGVLFLQSPVWAQNQNRLEDIGYSQAQQAAVELKAVKMSLLALDRVLADTEVVVQARRNSGNIAAGLSIAAAGVALAGSIYALKMLHVRSEGALMEAVMASAGTAVAGLISATTGTLSRFQQPNVQTDKVLQDLQQALDLLEKQIRQEARPEKAAVLTQLKNSLVAAAAGLNALGSQQSKETIGFLSIHSAQAAGSLLTLFSLSTGSGVMVVGHMMTSVANLSRLVIALTPTQTKAVLTELAKTRSQLQLALTEL